VAPSALEGVSCCVIRTGLAPAMLLMPVRTSIVHRRSPDTPDDSVLHTKAVPFYRQSTIMSTHGTYITVRHHA
jgi:hypothetical protein